MQKRLVSDTRFTHLHTSSQTHTDARDINPSLSYPLRVTAAPDLVGPSSHRLW